MGINENSFPYCNLKEKRMKCFDEGDAELDILYELSYPIKWLELYPSMTLTKFTKMHMRSGKDSRCCCVRKRASTQYASLCPKVRQYRLASPQS